MKKILITGSSGTIGTSLCKKLLSLGYNVTGIDKVDPQEEMNISFHKFNLTKYPHLIKDIDNFDIVIHLAANARVLNSIINPNIALENYIINHNIFEFTRINKIPRLLFASSRETYGDIKTLPVSEEKASHRNTKSPYTASKILGESLCYAYKECYNLDAKSVRFSNVYGKYDLSDRFVPKAIQYMKKNKTFEIWGENKTLDFTYIDDCIEGLIILINNWEKCPSEINLASGEKNTLLYAAEIIKKLLESKSKIKIIKSPKGEVDYYQADISKIKKLGWFPKTPLAEGLDKSVKYYN